MSSRSWPVLISGMSTLRDDGWRKVLEGITTVEEVLRVSEEDEDLDVVPSSADARTG